MKAGGIIPQRNRIESLGEQPADTLTLEIFPSGQSSYEIYDDDGETKDYEQGEYAITEIISDDNAGRTQIEIQSPEGEYQVPQRSYKLRLHIEEAPKAVEENGSTLDIFSSSSAYRNNPKQNGWFYDEESNELWVRPAGTSQQTFRLTVTK
ncbi:MAG: DUF5110 domain-containing protein [Balneolaceae bacterium]|nr:DUF5110 domain-containing protein [Balneolaceae bacterium]